MVDVTTTCRIYLNIYCSCKLSCYDDIIHSTIVTVTLTIAESLTAGELSRGGGADIIAGDLAWGPIADDLTARDLTMKDLTAREL